MLESIRIKDLGLISKAEVEFKTGFVAITGETGAGKTLLLDAVRILRGEKPSVVGSVPQASVLVDASIAVQSNDFGQRLSELGIPVEDNLLLISRTFPENGRSKTSIGGRQFPASTLEELSEFWLAIHGQHDSLRLMKSQSHRELLDSFGGEELAFAIAEFSSKYQDWKMSQAELAKVEKSRKELIANAENIKADLAIFDSLNVEVGDVENLAQIVERVSRKEEFKAALASALLSISNEDFSVTSSLRSAKQSLDKLVSDSDFNRISQDIQELLSQIVDLESELNSQFAIVNSEEDDLDSLMMKQRQLKSLLLRHGPNETDLIAWAESAKRQLALIDPDGMELNQLRMKVSKNHELAQLAAVKLSEDRKALSKTFSEVVTKEINELAMPSAEFSVDFSTAELSETGIDKIEFLFNANPGMKPQPLVNAASGGELSRVMLALEVALLSTSSPSVLIFDEVDAGVAGAAAISVGEKLAKLSQISQVLVVTHLPQIAVFADQHINVAKETDGFVTQTSIETLDDINRILELSRMLAGLEGSESATAHAKELVQMAQDFKVAIKAKQSQ